MSTKVRKRRMVGALAALALGVSMSGCSNLDTRTDDSNVTAHYVELPDGRQVVCVFWVSSSSTATGGGSIECDFGGAR